MDENPFKVEISTDGGKTWSREPSLDADQYFYAARSCRERSKLLRRHERIRRPDLDDKIIVVFYDGMPVDTTPP
jgi:hypothetical protein